MVDSPINYFYDGQIKRYLEQLVRAYSGFKYERGSRNGQPPMKLVVPCRMAFTSSSRIVANILNNQSSNSANVAPMITIYLAGVGGRRADLQNQAHVDTRLVVEREWDETTGQYTSNRGKSYTVKRLMPIPLMLSVQVDVWTTNMEQKLELLEQITRLTYPDFQIQNSENFLDWGALTTVTVRDDFNLSSRSVPIGTDTEIDIMTFNLEMPIWLSPPAIVTQQKVIEQVVTNIGSEIIETDTVPDINNHDLGRVITTPGNHHIMVSGDEITLLGENGSETDENGNLYTWEKYLWNFGSIRPAVSQIDLKLNGDIEGVGVIGTVQLDPNNPNKLIWQVDPDTLPLNTMAPIEAIIDPMRTYPGNGLPPVVEGARYLIQKDIGPSHAWPNLIAHTDDIIEFSNGGWRVAFEASTSTDEQFVTNFGKGFQLRWTGSEWVVAVEGEYPQGHWRLTL